MAEADQLVGQAVGQVQRSLPSGPLDLQLTPPRLALGAAAGAANAEGATTAHAAAKGVVGHHCARGSRLLGPKRKGGLLGAESRLLRCTEHGLLRRACSRCEAQGGDKKRCRHASMHADALQTKGKALRGAHAKQAKISGNMRR